MIDYGFEHRPRGGNNGFIGDGRFRHNYEVATKAEQRKDYEQAAHYYGEAVKAAKNEKHRTTAKNRRALCMNLLRQKNRALELAREQSTPTQAVSRDPLVEQLRALVNAPVVDSANAGDNQDLPLSFTRDVKVALKQFKEGQFSRYARTTKRD